MARAMKTGLAVGLIALALAGCGGNDSTSTVTITETTPRPGTTVGSASQTLGIGDAAEIVQDDSQGKGGQRQRVTLVAVKDPLPARCDEFGNCIKPRRGNRLLAVKVRVEGLDGPIDECGSNSLTLVTPSGYSSQPVEADQFQTPQLGCFKRRQGQPITGWQTLELPKREKRYIVSWRPANGNNADDLQWRS